jgi:probable O-glycosylation ligase (exosortase A-associated)
MNPHRLVHGFAYDFPFSAVVGTATLIGLVISREEKRLPITALTVVWISFALWISFTTLFAMYPDEAQDAWQKATKIMLFSFITVAVMTRRDRLDMLVWTIVLSIGFYGFKGGIFALTHITGASQQVLGPEGTTIGDNNSLALAEIMTVPLMRYLQLQAANKWIKYGLTILMLTSVVAIVGSNSRGAFLAGTTMGLFLWMKGRHRLRLAVILLLVGPVVAKIASDEWYERMGTIQTYEEDTSAMGRINAWRMAVNLANDRPIVGGGFDAFQAETYLRYSHDHTHRPVDAHSIYFKVLGEHGYVGLALFLALGWLALRHAKATSNAAKNIPDLRWAQDLAGMLQVSLIGFAVGGLFLGLTYFDLYYHLIAMIVITRLLVQRHLQENAEGAANMNVFAGARSRADGLEAG